jgi:two-component system chemotaxis response regulator CheB
MRTIELFAIGASAGGIDVLRTLVKSLPRDFPAALCIVVHVSPESPGVIPHILRSAGPMPAKHAEDGERILPGTIYVAPPDHHLLLAAPNRMRLEQGPKENMARPAVDPLFRSAAKVYGCRAAGVILSGGLGDGAAGLAEIKARGGVAIVQEPREAVSPSMPKTALARVAVDHCLRSDRLAECFTNCAGAPGAAVKVGQAVVSDLHIERPRWLVVE